VIWEHFGAERRAAEKAKVAAQTKAETLVEERVEPGSPAHDAARYSVFLRKYSRNN
jgi:hypothetical protein